MRLLSAIAILTLFATGVSAAEPGVSSGELEGGVPPLVLAYRLDQMNGSTPNGTPSAAGAGRSVTLDELEGLAVGNNPTLVQAAMRIRAAQAECLQVGLYPNPEIGYRGDEMGDQGTAGQQGAFLRQEVVTAGKLRLRRSVAYQEVQQAQFAWESQRRRVVNDVKSGYFELLAVQHAVDLNRRLVQVGEEGVRAAEGLLKAKEVSRIDTLQAQIEADTARLRLIDAENRLQAAWRQMAALLGLPDMEPCHVAGSLEDNLPQITWEDAVARLFAESPELAEAQTAVQRARCRVASQCAERIPNVELQMAGLHHNTTHDNLTSVQVGIPLPIFNRNQGNIGKAQAELAGAQQEVHRVELQLQSRLAASFQRYSSAKRQVEQYSGTILPNAKTSLDLVQAGYRQGEFGYIALLTAQRTFFQVNLDYLESLRQLRTSGVEIEGLLLGGGLSAKSSQ